MKHLSKRSSTESKSVKSLLDDKDKTTIIKMTYVPQYHTFDIECIMPSKVIPEVRRLNTRNFPNHHAFRILNGMFQVHQEVKLWIKDEKELRKEGWNNLTKKGKTLGNKDYPFTIGKKKGALLGREAIKGFIGISEKMVPYVVVRDGDKYWRFTEAEIRFILPALALTSIGKTVTMKGTDGHNWSYDGTTGGIRSPFFNLEGRYVGELVAFLRKAEII